MAPGSDAPTGSRKKSAHLAIIDAAASLFDANGYHQTSMDAIASAVGLSKPTLYQYFRSKSDILAGIHQSFIGTLSERQEARLNSGTPASVCVREMIFDLVHLMGDFRSHVRVFIEHHREVSHDVSVDVWQARRHYEEVTFRIIEDGIASGEFVSVDVRVAAFSIIGMCNWMYQWYDESVWPDLDDLAASVADLALGGMLVTAPSGVGRD